MNRTLRTVAIDSLRLPGDWRARLDSASVKALADSGEILQPPAIRSEDRSVIYGGDRLAALHLRGETEAEVWVVDCDESAATEMRLVENIYRRHDNRDFHMAQLVKLRAERFAETPDKLPTVVTSETNEEPRDVDQLPRGPKKSARGQAREEVAAMAGVTPEAVRKAEQRESARQKHDDGPQVGTQPPQQVLGGPAAGGAASPPAVPGLEVAVALDALDRILTGAVTAITKLAKDHPELVDRFPVKDLKWRLQREVAPGFRAMYPGGRCIYCKLVPSEQPNCGGCKGSGWLTKEQLKGDIPPQLRIEGPGEGIFVEGEFVTLQALAENAYPKRGRGPGQSRPAGRSAERHPAGAGAPAEGRAAVEVPPKKRGAVEAAALPPRVTVPLDHTRTVLEDDFSDAWTEDGDR